MKLSSCLMKLLQYLSLTNVLFAAPCFALTPNTVATTKMGEATLEYSLQEASGAKLNLGYYTPPGSVLSVLGLEIGERLYRGRDDQKKVLKASEYGPFMKIDLRKTESWTVNLKVAWNRLDLPKEASKKSLSRYNFVLSIQSVSDFYWDAGIGLSWRNLDHGTIEVGKDRLEKTLLFFPRIGFGLKF